MSEPMTEAVFDGEARGGIEQAGQYLTFVVSGERYAIGILDVKEIIEVSRLTRVPMTPAHIRGVINLRGGVVPVVDLSVRLGKSSSELTKRSCIVLVDVQSKGEHQVLGILVDAVNEILEIPASYRQQAPEFGTEIRTDFIEAMGRVDDVFIIILNINNVLSIAELAAIQEITESMDKDDYDVES